MTIRFNSRWLLVPLLILSLQSSRAQAPQGQFFYTFDNSTPIFDLTGNYNVDLDVVESDGTIVPISVNFFMNQDARGRLSSGGVITTGILIGSDLVAANYTVSGQMKTVNGIPVATIVIRIQGDGFFAGRTTLSHYTLTIVTQAQIDTEIAEIFGTSTVSGNFQGMGGLHGSAEFDTPLPDGMDGSWSLELNVLGLSKLTGSGVITLSNGRLLTMNLNGKFSPFTGAIAKLTGVGNSRGCTLGGFEPGDAEIFVTGKVMGQTVGPDAVGFLEP